jgi:desulfoferrodoxin-like iron-binding protein
MTQLCFSGKTIHLSWIVGIGYRIQFDPATAKTPRNFRQGGNFMGAVKDEIYKCEACGNVVMVLEGGDGDLVCCGEEMKLLTSDEAKAFANRMSKPGSP